MEKIKLSEIIISSQFSENNPSENKLEKCEERWLKNNQLDRKIVINKNNILLDGYVAYLIAKKHGIQEVNVERINEVYIYGIHPNSANQKEYVWKINNFKKYAHLKNSLEIGDCIFVNTKFGVSPIKITRIEESIEEDISNIKYVAYPYAYTVNGIDDNGKLILRKKL